MDRRIEAKIANYLSINHNKKDEVEDFYEKNDISKKLMKEVFKTNDMEVFGHKIKTKEENDISHVDDTGVEI